MSTSAMIGDPMPSIHFSRFTFHVSNACQVVSHFTVHRLLLFFLSLFQFTGSFSAISQLSHDTISVRIVTEVGTFVVDLSPVHAPITVANFLRYVDSGHYRGGSFYRTVRKNNQPQSQVKIAVIQAGAHPWRENEAFPPIALERTSETGLKHVDGAISMARAEPNTATSSFFICVGDQPELDFGGKRNPDGQGFAAFGRVVNGMDVVRRIHATRAEGQAIMPPVRIMKIERMGMKSEHRKTEKQRQNITTKARRR